jgi:tetratricopeptide (TPR) repeat protein
VPSDQSNLVDPSERLFQEGRWAELEDRYRSTLDQEKSDARTAFRLANLLSFQARWDEGPKLYDQALTYGLSGAIPLNNKGVVLAGSGDTQGSVTALLDAIQSDESCAPALYNLGIICESLKRERSLPRLLLDLGVGEPGTPPNEVARTYYEKAREGGWPSADLLDGPLLLWVLDLKPGFGYVPVVQIVNVDQGYELYDQGIALVQKEQWEEATARFAAAIRLHPPLQGQCQSMITYCQGRIARARLAGIQELWDSKNFEAASQAVDEFLVKSSVLSDRSFADEILAAGIETLAEQIRSHKPQDGWAALQKLITQARQRFERSESDALKDERERASREYIRQVCWQALSRQIEHLNATGDVDAAVELVDFAHVQWFVKTDVAGLRRQVYTAKAELCRARGHDARDRGAWREAIEHWLDARKTAVLADDLMLADSFDVYIDGLIQELPDVERAEALQQVRGTDDRAALRRCVEDLTADPGDPRLLNRRDALIKHLLAQARSAVDASQEEAAREIVEEILQAVPDQPEALRIFRTTQKETADRWIAQAEKASWEGSFEKAKKLCARVLGIFPDHAEARKLLREIEAHRDFSPDAYHQAYLDFVAARDAGNLKTAFKKALRLRELDRRAQHTEQAVEWVSEVLVEWLHARLEKERTREVAGSLLAELEPVLSLRPEFAPALILKEELHRILEGRDEERRQRSAARLEKARDALEQAREALDEGRPDAALKVLQSVLKLRDPGLRQEALTLQDQALEQLRHEIDGRIHRPTEKNLQEAGRLVEICSDWDPDFAAARSGEIERIQKDQETIRKLESDSKELEKLVNEQGGRPFHVLRSLDVRIRELDADGSDLLRSRRAEVLDLRRRVRRRAAGPMQRLRIWIYEHTTRIPGLDREDLG